MHYSNGRIAKVGDLVRGRGYNIKYEIVGIITKIHPNTVACNCEVAHVGRRSTPILIGWFKDGKMEFPQNTQTGAPVANYVYASTECGQTDSFVAIDENSGDILPPENS